MKVIIISIIGLLSCLSAAPASANPFISMTHKPYAEYADSLENITRILYAENDSVWVAQTVQQMREAAQVSGDKRWKLEADFLEFIYNYDNDWDKPSRRHFSEETLNAVQKIISLAKKNGYTALQLRGEFFIFTHYWHHCENHEKAFLQWNKVEKLLDPVPAEDFPLKPFYWIQIAVLYNYFGEYEKTVYYYGKVFETPEISLQQGHLEWTINELGLIYRNHYNDLEKSDSCFRAILELMPDLWNIKRYLHFTVQERNELWAALANGNLGTNHCLRGEYNEAIPLLVQGMEGAIKNNKHNYPYAAGKALQLAEIYMMKNDLSAVKQYADKAREWLDTERDVSRAHNIELWQKYYQTMLQYYRAKGNNANAWLYNDSVENAKRIADEEYNLRQLQRAEQEIQQEKLEAEQTLKHAYRRSFLISAAFVVVVVILLLFIIRYNRQITQKNRNLVARLKEQDQITEMNMQADSDSAEQTDENSAQQLLLRNLYAYLLQDAHYSEKIDANTLAAALAISRTRLFETVKNLTGKTLQDYINSLRLDQARQMLETTTATVETIATDCGFFTVRTFYRLFRESYGMTPAQYRKIVVKS
ncbi:MAG: helix-turn-helix domain-containing protein [Paludibacter sp.]|nr:helix-turn-helix domain-containing protein [Paludibacter sp.]